MNLRNVFFQLGLLLLVLSLFMFAIAAWASLRWLLDWSVSIEAMQGLWIGGGIAAAIGGAMVLVTRTRDPYIGRREALLLVALSWLVGALVAAMPYFTWAMLSAVGDQTHPFDSFVDCYFETMSGLTTTGATVLSDIEAIPKSLLLWRALTHWLGGIGIVVLFVAVLPTLGVGGKKLFRVEAPGPSPKGLQPSIRETARVLIFIYLGITAASVLLLRATGAMSWFDALCHTFSMVSTGGLSTRNASIGAYDNAAVDFICMFFMIAAGVNFAVFYMIVRGQWRKAWKDVELRVYLALKIIAIVLVMVSMTRLDTIATMTGKIVDLTWFSNVQYSGFQVIALHTGTGFTTANYEPWPFLAKTMLIGLMFIGGCGGSTAGGVKVIRFWILLKVIISSLERSYRPQVVRPLKVAGSVLDEETKLSAIVYVVTFVVLFCLGAVVVRLLELHTPQCDFATAMSASVSTLGNIGPGVHGVGPLHNYGWFSAPSKLVMCVLMALGRLEVFAVIVLFSPRFWRGN